MSRLRLTLAGATLLPLPSGALWWPEARLLAVADLHLERSARVARLGGGLLPPYETADTLARLAEEVALHDPEQVVCLGDSFDDMEGALTLDRDAMDLLLRLAAGRRWIWIAGNHDPGPLDLPGTHLAELAEGPLVFRHIARRDLSGDALGEVSGHYHPKLRMIARGQHVARPCFLADRSRLIMPAFGTYTGGLDVRDRIFDLLFGPDAVALAIGRTVTALPRAGVV